jgi:hypothetical protein
MSEVLVTVARYDWRAQAVFARCRLESCGIECFLADEHTLSIRWPYALAFGGLRLQVQPDDAEDAVAVLNDPGEEPVEPILAPDEAAADHLFRTAAASTVAAPVLCYGIWLLIQIAGSGISFGAKARRKAIMATALLLALPVMAVLPGMAALLS